MNRVRVGKAELNVRVDGPAGAPAIVFSNSIGTTLEMWDAQAAALSGRWRCVRYDTRGHGGSSTVDRPATIDDLADDLAGLLDALDIGRAHVVGLSLGGMTAQAFASRHPARVRGLALLATAAHLPPAEAWAQRARTVRAEGMAAIVEAVIPRWFTPAFVEARPDAVDAVRRRFVANDPRGYAACCEVIRDMDLRGRLPAIAAPTLVIAGADDPATPVSMMEDIRARVPDAELLVLPRAAHLLAVERADRVNRALAAFLEDVEGR